MVEREDCTVTHIPIAVEEDSEPDFPRDHRLAAVINRYEDGNAAAEGPISNTCVETHVDNPEIESLVEKFDRMPTSKDPGLWRVRVGVSLSPSLDRSTI